MLRSKFAEDWKETYDNKPHVQTTVLYFKKCYCLVAF